MHHSPSHLVTLSPCQSLARCYALRYMRSEVWVGFVVAKDSVVCLLWFFSRSPCHQVTLLPCLAVACRTSCGICAVTTCVYAQLFIFPQRHSDTSSTYAACTPCFVTPLFNFGGHLKRPYDEAPCRIPSDYGLRYNFVQIGQRNDPTQWGITSILSIPRHEVSWVYGRD